MGSTFKSHPDLKIDADFTVGSEAANVINVAVQLVDRLNGNEVAEAVPLMWYLSSDAAGQSVASAPSAGTAIGTDGTIIAEITAEVFGYAITEADGDIDFDIEEAGSGTWYLNLVMPDGKREVSGAITFS